MRLQLSPDQRSRRWLYSLAVGLALACVPFTACQSPKVAEPSNDWQTVSLADGQLRIAFPGMPTSEDAEIDSPDGPVSVQARKFNTGGIFFKAVVMEFPAATIAAKPDLMAFVEQSSVTWEKAKPGAARENMEPIEGESVPAFEHRFSYPASTLPNGQPIQSGFAIHGSWLIGNFLCTAFVDVLESSYDANPAQIDQQLDAFFRQVKVIPSAPAN